MMIFRGVTEQGEVVEGYYFKVKKILHYILKFENNGLLDKGNSMWQVVPESLACSIGQLDKHKKEIFGSFEYEKGKMSRGGDRVGQAVCNTVYDVIFKDGALRACLQDSRETYSLLNKHVIETYGVEIIGSQWEPSK